MWNVGRRRRRSILEVVRCGSGAQACPCPPGAAGPLTQLASQPPCAAIARAVPLAARAMCDVFITEGICQPSSLVPRHEWTSYLNAKISAPPSGSYPKDSFRRVSSFSRGRWHCSVRIPQCASVWLIGEQRASAESRKHWRCIAALSGLLRWLMHK